LRGATSEYRAGPLGRTPQTIDRAVGAGVVTLSVPAKKQPRSWVIRREEKARYSTMTSWSAARPDSIKKMRILNISYKVGVLFEK